MAGGGLDLNLEVFCRENLPGGSIRQGRGGPEWWVRCPFHPEREPSFSVSLVSGVYHCFGCGTGGGFLELVERLGLEWSEIKERYGRNGRPRARAKKSHKKPPNWEQIWLQADPNGQVALRYLRNRGLPVERLPEFFQEYRTADGKTLLLVKLINRSGQNCGFQRIFLTQDGQKAPEIKKAWPGSKLRGAFALIGVTSEEFDQTETLAVTEGPETGLAVHLATGWPTLVAISASNLPAIDYPKQARIVFFADKDRSKAGEREARKAVQRLRARGQRATYILPPGEIPEEQKSLDFLDTYNYQGPEVVRELAEKALRELEAQEVEEVRFSPDRKYCFRKGAIWKCKDSEPEKFLASFTARITEDFLLDFGSGETQRFYQIKVKINEKIKKFWIKASKLSSSAWVEESLGSEARIAPGSTTLGYLTDAIKSFSSPRRRIEPARAGWVKEGNEWRFRLPGSLAREILGLSGHPYELFEDPDPAKAREAANLLLHVAPEEAVIGMMGAALYAPLSFFLRKAGINQGLGFYLHGRTGHGKTTLARLVLALYGPKWVFEGDLPAIFNSTPNYLQAIGFYWSYLPLVIDDLHPPRSTEERRHLTEIFSKVLRTAANLAHRGRLQDSNSLQVGQPFGGAPVFTGEVSLNLLPSEATRLIQIPLERPLNWEVVSRLQENPEGLASLGTLWIKWIERQGSSLVARLRVEVARYRKEFVDFPPRIRDNFTILKVTFELFFDFLKEDLNIDPADWWEAARIGLSRLIGRAEEAYRQSDPVELFKSVFCELERSGTLIFPASSEALEVREIHGFKLENNRFFVFPRKILSAINDFLSRSGLPLLPPERDLWKMLEECGVAEKPRTHHIPGLGKVWGRIIQIGDKTKAP